MRYALLGALLMVGGIAARIEAARHHSHLVGAHIDVAGHCVAGSTAAWSTCSPVYVGWTSTVYDLVRIGGWALLIFGAVIVAFALVREPKR